MTAGGMGQQANLLGGRYRLLRELGRGGFGHTYLAEDLNRFNELCVLKEFVPQVTDDATLQKAQQLFEREAGVLYQLNHPQIPRFRELLRVYSNHQGRLFLVQDYVEGPTYQSVLETRLRSGSRFSETEVIHLMQNVLPVLGYIHSVGVIHRDIAPDNLIMRNADGLPVLIDFGGVKQVATLVQQQIGNDAPTTRLGKVGYAPEEQMESGVVAPNVDLYALAATALTLLTGESPQSLYDPYHKTWRWREYISLSPNLERVLLRMLSPQPSDRYSSASAVLQALQPPNTYTPRATHPDAPQSAATRPDPTVAVAPGNRSDTTLPRQTYAVEPIPAKQSRTISWNGCWQALLGLLVLMGAVGLVWWIASRWEPNAGPSTESPAANDNGSESSSENPAFSPEEQARKRTLRQRRNNLGVNERFLVSVTDQLFYARYPEAQGRPLSDRPEDAELRMRWDNLALEVLDILETHLSAQARQRLGSYSPEIRGQWQQTVNQLYVSSSALFDLTDAKFAALFPEQASGDFINQPIGQIWYGIADDRVQALQSGDRLEELQFEAGSYSQSVRDRLGPGEGRVYIANLSEGQILRLNLQAPNNSTRLSIYVPRPDENLPHLLADANETTWSGQLTQTGYYEIVVVSTLDQPLDYGLDVAVDNVTSTPAEPPAEPEAKN